VSRSVGLLWPQTSSMWTAGTLYFENLLGSIDLAGRLGDVVVIEPEAGAFSRGGDPRVPVVTYRESSKPGKAASVARLVRRQIGLEHRAAYAAVSRSGVSSVFGDANLISRFPVPWVGWLADFQHREAPEYFDAEEIRVRDRGYRRLAQTATRVLLSSEDAAGDFARFAPDLAGKARVAPFVSLLPQSFYEGEAAPVVAKYNIRGPFLVVPNQWWRHKNHEVAIRAAALLRDADVDVQWVFTGAPSDYRDASHISALLQMIAVLDVGPRIAILGNLPRGEQLQLMRAAAGIVQPSLFEGWSTVVEDAKTLGQRLVVSDIPVHREQRPPAALFFDPRSAEDLAAQVRTLLASEIQRIDERQAREAARERAIVFADQFLGICDESATVPFR
jgi:glycosyltransferase involved in cell wall biosynthesis